MTVLVTGGRGQLGRALAARGATAVDRATLDICNPAQIESCLIATAPTAVINCAGYTAVERAETEPALACAVNHDGAARLAEACRAHAVPLIHISTDYVFDGTGMRPYLEDDPLTPLSVYGVTKAAGERAVHAAGGIVVRTSWLFGEGGPSFVHTMMRLAQSRPVLRVVADQHGCPTYTGDLADMLLALAQHAIMGETLEATYHYCGTGATTWHGFASVVVDELRLIAPASIVCTQIEAISTADYPMPAPRPVYAVLSTARVSALGFALPHWRTGVRRVVADEIACAKAAL